RLVQVEFPAAAVRGDRVEVPVLGVHADDLARGPERPGFFQVPLAFRAAAETDELAVGGPGDVVDLRRLVLDPQLPRADRRLVRVEVNRGRVELVIAGAPGDVSAVGADCGAAAGNLQVDDLVPVRLDRQDCVAEP